MRISFLFSKKEKKRFTYLIIFSILVSLIEVIGISAIMPFIDISIDFQSIHQNIYYSYFYEKFGFSSEVEFAITFGLLLMVFYFFRGFANFIFTYQTNLFSQRIYSSITKKLFDKYLTMPYVNFTSYNLNFLSKNLVAEANYISLISGSILLVVSEFFVIIMILTVLLAANWKITLIFSLILVIKLLLLGNTITSKIKKAGDRRLSAQNNLFELINRLLKNFKLIKLMKPQDKVKLNNEFHLTVDEFAFASALNNIFGAMPRIILETIGFSMIVLFLVVLLYKSESDISFILPTLSLFILSLYRLLPSVNRIVSSVNKIIFYRNSLKIIETQLDQTSENNGNNKIRFDDKIELKDIFFKYEKNKILTNRNLEIKKGEKVAFIGESGSGKTTLVDIVIGLLQPTEGYIYIDGELLSNSNIETWRSSVGYIPQDTTLFDGSISDNICFGREFNSKKIKDVLDKVNLLDFVKTKDGLDTMVGDNGVQLSGGQIQRVVIARAIYDDPDIIVLDEATSALDKKNESKILQEIFNSTIDKTLIIISHNVKTLTFCDKIYEIKDQKLIQLSSNT